MTQNNSDIRRFETRLNVIPSFRIPFETLSKFSEGETARVVINYRKIFDVSSKGAALQVDGSYDIGTKIVTMMGGQPFQFEVVNCSPDANNSLFNRIGLQSLEAHKNFLDLIPASAIEVVAA